MVQDSPKEAVPASSPLVTELIIVLVCLASLYQAKTGYCRGVPYLLEANDMCYKDLASESDNCQQMFRYCTIVH